MRRGSTDRYKEYQSRYHSARRVAVNRLIEAHRDEYSIYFEQARAAAAATEDKSAEETTA